MPKGNPPGGKKSKPPKPITTDPRFTHIHNDPRFAPAPRKDAKLTIDKRFRRMLSDGDFTQKASVDRYGRRIGREAGKEEIRRYYNIEKGEGEGGEEEGEEERGGVYDPARGEGVVSTDESSTDGDETEEEVEVGEEAASGLAGNGDIDVPLGDVSRRFAVVNLDWDNVRAVDLLKAFSSFATGSGRVVSVTIYPSEFGKERMEREEMEGPPTDIFRLKGNTRVVDSEDSADDEGEVTEKTIVKEDKGEEFDSGKLRNYQLERLRYFYAVVECDSPSTAKYIYDQCDGAEYETTANFFDLRFIPNDTSFEDDKPREKCTEVPANYRPIEFTTDALQHSKVKLTWDEDDQHRKLATKRAFSQRDIEDMELKDYLASSDSGSEAEDAAAAKEKYRALLSATGLGGEGKGEPVSGMEVTFTSGLSENARGGKVIETEELEESTIERYARKEKERRQKRKEKMQAAREGNPTEDRSEESIPKEAPTSLGFDDPFFDGDAPASRAQEKKEKKRKDKETKAKEAAELESKRTELSLLMMDEDEGLREDGTKLRHFDMKQIVKAEKNKGKKKRKHGRSDEQGLEGIQDGFEIDVKDSRFAAVYNNHEFAIDPTNPRFVKTKAMNKLMEERRNRARQRSDEGLGEEQEAERRGKRQKADKDNGKGKKDELARLVQSLKNKSAKKVK